MVSSKNIVAGFVAVALAVTATVSTSARAATFDSSAYAALLVKSDGSGLGSGGVKIDVYSPGSGVPLYNLATLPETGPNAVVLPLQIDNDRKLHRSADGRFLTFAGYNVAASASVDPATLASSVVPRVVARIGADLSVDTSTRLSDGSYSPGTTLTFTSPAGSIVSTGRNAIRSAATVDGTSFYTAGDNDGGTTLSGGLRYTTLASSGSVNLSRNQALPTTATPATGTTPDNVRDVGVFGSRLYYSGGSNASGVRGVYTVGVGLPVSGAQTTSLVYPSDGISTTGFVLLDANAAVAGPDVLYTVVTNAVRKYVFNGTTWVSAQVAVPAVYNLDARLNGDGTVTVIASAPGSIYSLTDLVPTTSGLAGVTPAVIATAPVGFEFGGVAFVPEPSTAGLLAVGVAVLARRRR